MRGRSQRLSKPYRNNQSIMRMAKTFYNSRIHTEDDEVNLPDEPTIRNMPQGPEPRLIHMPSVAPHSVVSDQLKELLRTQLNPGDILVIDASGYQETHLLEHLQRQFPDSVTSASTATTRSQTRVTTIGACTGLEAPVVILIGLDRLFEAEEKLDLDPTERDELIKRNTKKVFAALTRAAQKLLIIYRNPNTKRKLHGLEHLDTRAATP